MKTKLILILAMILGSLLMQSCYCELWDYGPVCRIDVPPPPPTMAGRECYSMVSSLMRRLAWL